MDTDDALNELLPGRPSTPQNNTTEELVAAAAEAWRRRQVNTDAGAAVIAELHQLGWSYKRIADATGIPAATAHRWGRPPGADQ